MCGRAAATFTRLQRVLGAIDESALAADLPDGFERTRVGAARAEPAVRSGAAGFRGWCSHPTPLALAAAVVVLVGAAFFAGRLSSPATPATTTAATAAEQVRERILLVDLGEHLDRSQMMLVELVSADAESTFDISGERGHAEELLADNRLYRQTANVYG